MKKYSLEWLQLQKNLTRVTKPKPFPGKYPTRIAWAGMTTTGKSVSYVGKPSLQAIKRLRTLIDRYQLVSIWAIEFDRNGIIAKDGTYNPAVRGRFSAATIRLNYHPADNAKFFEYPVRTVTRFDRNGKFYRIYEIVPPAPPQAVDPEAVPLGMDWATGNGVTEPTPQMPPTAFEQAARDARLAMREQQLRQTQQNQYIRFITPNFLRDVEEP